MTTYNLDWDELDQFTPTPLIVDPIDRTPLIALIAIDRDPIDRIDRTPTPLIDPIDRDKRGDARADNAPVDFAFYANTLEDALAALEIENRVQWGRSTLVRSTLVRSTLVRSTLVRSTLVMTGHEKPETMRKHYREKRNEALAEKAVAQIDEARKLKSQTKSGQTESDKKSEQNVSKA